MGCRLLSTYKSICSAREIRCTRLDANRSVFDNCLGSIQELFLTSPLISMGLTTCTSAWRQPVQDIPIKTVNILSYKDLRRTLVRGQRIWPVGDKLVGGLGEGGPAPFPVNPMLLDLLRPPSYQKKNPLRATQGPLRPCQDE